MSKAEKRTRGFNSRIEAELKRTRSLFALTAGAAGVGLVAKSIFDLGAAVEETGSKFDIVFGASSSSVQRFIDKFGTLAGLSQTQAKEILATTGAIVQGMGFAQSASADFATEVVKLAGDLSSFNNIPVAETARAIQSALTGERESLKRLSIVILESDVQQKALMMTGKESAKALTQQEKAIATLALITERAGVQVGNLAETQDSAANKARALTAEFTNIMEAMSVAFLPAMVVGVSAMHDFIRGLQVMGVESAVVVAKIELAFARFAESGAFTALGRKILGIDQIGRAFGADLSRSVVDAEANLRRISTAAEIVSLEMAGFTERLAGFREALNSGIGGLGGGGTSGDVVSGMTASFDQSVDDAQRLLDAIAQLNFGFQEQRIRLEEGEVAALRFGLAMEGITGFTQEGIIAQREFNDALRLSNEVANRGTQITREMRTAQERQADTMKELNTLIAAGAISQETYARAVDQATAAQDRLNDSMLEAMSRLSALSRLSNALGFEIPGLDRAVALLGASGALKGLGGSGGSGGTPGVDIPIPGFGGLGPSKAVGFVGAPQAIRAGPQVVHHYSNVINLNALDAQSVARVLKQNKGVIAEIMVDAVRNSGAVRQLI